MTPVFCFFAGTNRPKNANANANSPIVNTTGEKKKKNYNRRMADEIPSLFSTENRTIPVLVLHGAKSLNRRPLAAAAAAAGTMTPPRRTDDRAEASRRLSEARPTKARPGSGGGSGGVGGGDGGGGGSRGGGGRVVTHDMSYEGDDGCEVGRGRWGSIFAGDGIFTEDDGNGGDYKTSPSDVAGNNANVDLAGVGSGGAVGSGGGGGGGRRGEARGERGSKLQDGPHGEGYVLVRNKLEGFFSAERRARLERAGNLDRLEDCEFIMPATVQLEKASLLKQEGVRRGSGAWSGGGGDGDGGGGGCDGGHGCDSGGSGCGSRGWGASGGSGGCIFW